MDEVGVVGSGPRKYMSKRQSACDSCRARKSACRIDTRPPCRLCVAHGKACTFVGYKVRRTAGTSVHQSTSEGSLDQVPNSPQEASPSVSSSGTFTRDQSAHGILQPPLPAAIEDTDWGDFFSVVPGMPAMQINDEPAAPNDTLFEASEVDNFAMDLFGQEMEGFDPNVLIDMYGTSPQIQTSPNSLDQLINTTAELCGLTGDMDPYVLRRYRYNSDGTFGFSKLSIRSTQDDAMPVQFLMSPSELSSECQEESELGASYSLSANADRKELEKLIPVEIGRRLISLFLRLIGSQLPIISYSSLPEPNVAPTGLLAAIYCITLPFAIYDDRLCIEFAYKSPSAPGLFSIAWRSFNRSLPAPSVTTVQTGLLLLLRPSVNDLVLDSAFKWALLGTVVSVAHTIGLHLDASTWKLPPEEIFQRRRVSWAVFAFDKWLALSFGRPSHINRDDWLVTELMIADISETSNKFAAETSVALHFSSLTIILDRVLADLYSLRNVASLTTNYKATLEKSRVLLATLTTWFQCLDPSFHATPADGDIMQDLDPRFTIHICYHAVKITIIRALLRPFYHAGAKAPDSGQDYQDWQTTQAYCRIGAETCAAAALNQVSSLGVSHHQAFWPPWCKTHFALITNLLCLLAITCRSSESSKALAKLNRARAIYRMQARSFSIIRFALLRIDAIFWRGLDAVILENGTTGADENTDTV